jgi:purine-cytosine permease-like protein
MLLWTISIVIGVIALIGVLLVPGRTRIEQNDDLEGYERRWKVVVYIIGFVVIGGAAFLVLEMFIIKAVEAGELWAKIDMGLFTALGLGIIVYNAYTAKLVAKMREEE